MFNKKNNLNSNNFSLFNNEYLNINPNFKIARYINKEGYLIIDSQNGHNFHDEGTVNKHVSSKSWLSFSENWNRLSKDEFMKDGGTYRFRRHSVFIAEKNDLNFTERPKISHFQSVGNNKLNGGIERWFDPIETEIINNEAFNYLLKSCLSIFNKVADEDLSNKIWNKWFIEAHQFRIVARSNIVGLPTPEGVHDDGVCYIFMLVVNRDNVTGGISSIYDKNKTLLKSQLLYDGECAYLNDKDLMHGVSAIECVDKNKDGNRDVFVLTFKRCL